MRFRPTKIASQLRRQAACLMVVATLAIGLGAGVAHGEQPAGVAAAKKAYKTKDYAKALAGFETALSKAPKNKTALQGRVRSLMKLGRWNDAAEAARSALTVHAKWPVMTRLLGESQLEAGDPAAAAKTLSGAEPSDLDALFLLGRAYQAQGASEEAKKTLGQYVKQEKRQKRASKVNEAKAMLTELDKGGENKPTPTAPPKAAPEIDRAALLAEADKAHAAGEFLKAGELFNTLAGSSKNPEHHYKAGVNLALGEDLRGAAVAWEACAHLAPGMALCTKRLALLKEKMAAGADEGPDAEALNNPEEAPALAERYLDEARPAMALRVANRYLIEQPDSAKWRRIRGLALVQVGRYAAAEDDLRVSLRQDPRDTRSLLAMADVSSALGYRNEAHFLERLLADPALSDALKDKLKTRAKE